MNKQVTCSLADGTHQCHVTPRHRRISQHHHAVTYDLSIGAQRFSKGERSTKLLCVQSTKEDGAPSRYELYLGGRT